MCLFYVKQFIVFFFINLKQVISTVRVMHKPCIVYTAFSSHFQLKYEMSNIIKGMIVNYTGMNRTTEHTWDYIQRTVS